MVHGRIMECMEEFKLMKMRMSTLCYLEKDEQYFEIAVKKIEGVGKK